MARPSWTAPYPDADARRKPTNWSAPRSCALHERAGCFAYPSGTCHEVVLVSTARKGWSGAYIRPTGGNGDTVQSDVGSLKRRNGRWRVHQLGNGGGCGVPQVVVLDLKLACFTVDGMRFLPRPVQRPGLPVWVAG